MSRPLIITKKVHVPQLLTVIFNAQWLVIVYLHESDGWGVEVVQNGYFLVFTSPIAHMDHRMILLTNGGRVDKTCESIYMMLQ